MDKIEEAILTFCENTPGGLCIGVATDQNPNSTQAAMGAAIIDLLLGNVEQPGSLLQRFGTQRHVFYPGFPIGFCDRKLPYEQLEKRLGGNEYKGLHMWHAAHAPSCLQALKTGKPYPIKAWIDRSGNKLAVLANGKEWVEAMDNLDLIVHMYMYPTSFSAYADILLPTTEWLETNYTIPVCNTLICRQAVTHLYETMDESLIWSKLTKRLGELGHESCAKAFDAEYMGLDLPYWNTMEELLDRQAACVGMTWEDFKEGGDGGDDAAGRVETLLRLPRPGQKDRPAQGLPHRVTKMRDLRRGLHQALPHRHAVQRRKAAGSQQGLRSPALLHGAQ